MKNTSVRLLIVASLVVLLAASMWALPEWLTKEIRLPDWDLAELPVQFDTWRGAEAEVPADVKRQLLRDAEAIVDRAYADEQNHVVSLHVALFRKLDDGIRHSPFNCYRGTGWREIGTERLMLPVSDDSSIPVSLTTWEREGRRVMVMYWYQFDEHILFDRWDLGKARWKMRNKKTWPAMIKVMLQTSAGDRELGRERIQEVARMAYQWLDQQADQPHSSGAGA